MKASKRALSAAAVALTLALAGCDTQPAGQALCVLVDVSGTYADEKPEVAKILKRDVLPAMVPGDTLIVLRIDSESYEKDNLVALTTLDPRPSRANAQKLALARKLDAFAEMDEHSRYTDIPGAMMLGSEYLREIPSRSRVMLVFSDLREDLPDGSTRSLDPAEFAGIELAAVNVKRLERDTADPSVFRARLAAWERRARRAGASGWRTLLDPSKLAPFLAELREAPIQLAAS